MLVINSGVLSQLEVRYLYRDTESLKGGRV